MNKNNAADPATDYATAVCKGKVVAGPHVRLACKRHLDDLKDGPARGLKWDLAKAARAIGFFANVLTLPEVCGRICLRKSWVYDAVQRGEFPKPVHLTPRRVVWRESEIETWKAERIAARDQG